MVEYGRIWLPHFGYAGDRVGFVRVCGVYLAGVSLAVIMFHYVSCDLSFNPHSTVLKTKETGSQLTEKII